MDISVIVVNYNTAQLVKKCVETLITQQDVKFEVIVIDNASTDDSLALLQQFGNRIKLIANKTNKGFGSANNTAFKSCKGRYVFLLNPDAVCLSNTDLYHAVRFMDDHPQFGLAGTRIIDEAGNWQVSAWDHYPRQDQSSVDFSHLPGEWATVLGASMLIRRDAYEKVCGFDEKFFLYAEETDLCLRLRKQGYLIGYCETVTVQHVGGASERSNPRAETIRRKKSAKYLFYSKHYSKKDVLGIVRRDLKHARLHLFQLYIKKLFHRLSEKQQAAFNKHQVSYELARDFLQK